MQQHFKQFVGETKKTSKKVFGISEAELLKFDCVSRLLYKDSVGYSSDWFIFFRHIPNFVSSGDTLNPRPYDD